ncbi:MAG: master DNA invertase Mpi family serine-type recombinase [Bacteroidales bacterium]|nr:master DNA invertase Mpi family serine-type recombinase [Bacteroidales bacterium]
MIYGYIRVSTDHQTTLNQEFEITRFCRGKSMEISGWIRETISGTQAYDKRALGKLLRRVGKGDLIICTEISRLGRKLYMIMEILSTCMNKGCQVWTVKEGYRLGDDIQSKVLAFAFGLSAEIERRLISARTREALARRKAEGKRVGRPEGSKSKVRLLDERKEEILAWLAQGESKAAIARRLGVSRGTFYQWEKGGEFK